jgi:signal transduction histidine kinase
VDAGEIATTVSAAITDRYAAKNVTLSTDISRSPRLWADRQRLAQVLGNLLDNALRHTPAGGRVSLAVAEAAGEIVFTVADDGDGIAAEHLPHIFERFYRADSARDRGRGGSGIGLAIVKALIEAHGGHVSAASRGRGHGTTFTVRVPIGAPAASPTA